MLVSLHGITASLQKAHVAGRRKQTILTGTGPTVGQI